MRRNLIVSCGCLFLFLASCMVGPNYHRPCLDIPSAYYYEENDAVDSLDLSWWKQFQDPVLEALIDEALAYNKDIKIAAANIEQASGVYIQTRSQLFPQIGYNFLGERQRLSATTATPLPITVPNPQTFFQGIATASWEIDLWGRIRRECQSAQAQIFATVEARRGVILSLVAAVANNYLMLRGLDEQLVISKNTQRSYLEALNYFQLQFDHGQVSQMLVAQAETQYEIASAKIPEIQLQIVQVENLLSVLLGRNPGHIERGKSISDLAFPDVPAGIPSEILTQRPDILQAEQILIAANAQIGAAQALYFPSVTLTGAYGGASQELKNLFKGPSKIWNYAGNITGPILTFGAIYGQVVQAVGEQQAALYGYELAIQKAFSDVENALSSHIQLKDELAAQERLVKAATEYTYLAKLQYDGGYSPYFVVIQAQTQLFPSELSWVQSRVLLFSSLVSIYQAMGGGWVFIAEQMT